MNRTQLLAMKIALSVVLLVSCLEGEFTDESAGAGNTRLDISSDDPISSEDCELGSDANDAVVSLSQCYWLKGRWVGDICLLSPQSMKNMTRSNADMGMTIDDQLPIIDQVVHLQIEVLRPNFLIEAPLLEDLDSIEAILHVQRDETIGEFEAVYGVLTVEQHEVLNAIFDSQLCNFFDLRSEYF